MRPTVFLPLLGICLLLCLCCCKDRIDDDFETAWADYEPAHVSGTDK
jgi:hypothetical protein